MTRILTGSNHQEIALITDTYRVSDVQYEFLPAENKILEVTLAIAYYLCRNQICAAEYHLAEDLVCLTVDNTRQFEEFYDAVSETGFSSLHTHRLLYEAVMRRRDIFESSMVFLILSSWDTETGSLLKELDQNGLQTAVCFIGENESDMPDLSGCKSCTLIPVSPFAELTKEPGV